MVRKPLKQTQIKQNNKVTAPADFIFLKTNIVLFRSSISLIAVSLAEKMKNNGKTKKIRVLLFLCFIKLTWLVIPHSITVCAFVRDNKTTKQQKTLTSYKRWQKYIQNIYEK